MPCPASSLSREVDPWEADANVLHRTESHRSTVVIGEARRASEMGVPPFYGLIVAGLKASVIARMVITERKDKKI